MADCAELVKFGPQLCGAGRMNINGECVDMVRGRCPDDYYEANIASSTFSAISVGVRCMNTYGEINMPDYFYPIYNGVLVKFGPTFCDADQIMANGQCQPRAQGRCPDNFYHTLINSNTFSALTIDGTMCMNSYHQYELSELFYPIYNGILVPFGPTLCAAGLHYSDGECVPLSRGDCPADYHDITVKESTLIPSTAGACGAGYSSFGLGTNCTSRPTGAALCAILCDGDELYTGMGTCAAGCDSARVIRTSTGVSIPLYAEPLTHPALGVGVSGGACYGNMMPGAGIGTVNIDYDDTTYHLAD